MDSAPSTSDALIAGLLAGAVSWGAWRSRLLSASGAWAAAFIGGATFLAGWAACALLLFFFFSSALVARVASVARHSEFTQHQAEPRSAGQVLAVGLFPALAALTAAFTGEARWLWAMSAAIGFALSDTWSTDWGQASKSPPRWLGFGAELVPGQSGGMTLRGTLAGLAGALLFAGSAAWLLSGGPAHLLILAAVAWGGSLLDSVLGALVQWKGECAVCGQLTERKSHCGAPALTRRAGWSNEGVNFACSAVCLALGALAA